ncbi:MAG: Jag N-terminal domain-containing protein [Campylobacterota bacterium]|nr:Jag N-terminal domain-containing protein [Campylobacterota bacterium]
MIKIESESLESAYAEAAKHLECSVTELNVEVVQSPSKGFLSFFKKTAIIVATCKVVSEPSIAEPTPAPAKVVEEVIPTDDQEEAQALEKSFAKRQNNSNESEHEQFSEEYFDEDLPVDDIVSEVQEEINALFDNLCFNIKAIAVSMYDENTLLVEFNGDDAALLIGKEGYRYKALSYMIFNWINGTYHLQLRLEIAEFLQNQEEAMDRYLEGVCENIEKDGRSQTKVLDGVLVQIALKELRTRYPEKYVAIRSTRDGAKFIIINDYNEY